MKIRKKTIILDTEKELKEFQEYLKMLVHENTEMEEKNPHNIILTNQILKKKILMNQILIHSFLLTPLRRSRSRTIMTDGQTE